MQIHVSSGLFGIHVPRHGGDTKYRFLQSKGCNQCRPHASSNFSSDETVGSDYLPHPSTSSGAAAQRSFRQVAKKGDW